MEMALGDPISIHFRLIPVRLLPVCLLPHPLHPPFTSIVMAMYHDTNCKQLPFRWDNSSSSSSIWTENPYARPTTSFQFKRPKQRRHCSTDPKCHREAHRLRRSWR